MKRAASSQSAGVPHFKDAVLNFSSASPLSLDTPLRHSTTAGTRELVRFSVFAFSRRSFAYLEFQMAALTHASFGRPREWLVIAGLHARETELEGQALHLIVVPQMGTG